MRNPRLTPAGWSLLAATALVLAGCGTPPTSGDSAASADSTLRVATVGEPTTLDPIFSLSADSDRINNQIYETLTRLEDGSTSNVVAGLATDWTANDTATEWTFTLREGVKFQDGTPFDAQAVVANFERWLDLPVELQPRAYAFSTVFGAFGAESALKSVDAPDARTVTLTLSAPRPNLPIQLSLAAFGIASPTALEKYDANNTGEALSAFASAHPTGTGPFTFSVWNHGSNVVLTRNDDYWGEPAKLAAVDFRVVSESTARLNALEAGDVDVADQIAPSDLKSISEGSGLKVDTRDSCNTGYIAMKNAQAPFDNPLVRQAVAHAIDKRAIVERYYGGQGVVATTVAPPTMPFFDTTLQAYDYDPELAKKLLAQAGQPKPSIDFWYPTDMTRPWLTDSKGVFDAISQQLEAVGFEIKPHSATWTSFVGDTAGSAYQMYLFGWSCNYGAIDDFYNGPFGYANGRPAARYEYASDEFESALAVALAAPLDDQAAAWKTVQGIVHRDLPVVPFVHGASAVAMSDRVKGYVPSPMLTDRIVTVSLGE